MKINITDHALKRFQSVFPSDHIQLMSLGIITAGQQGHQIRATIRVGNQQLITSRFVTNYDLFRRILISYEEAQKRAVCPVREVVDLLICNQLERRIFDALNNYIFTLKSNSNVTRHRSLQTSV